MTPRKVAAVFMRGGTSKGLFFHEADLPADPRERDRLLLAAMGSPDAYGRQLNGLGGGISSLSKIIIVRPSADEAADVDYLHGQVAVFEPVIDYSANCGNLSGAVGPFAINQGLVPADGEEVLVRLRNLNTGDLIHAHVPVSEGAAPNSGDFAFPGVGGQGSRIRLDYIRPGDGLLFPTGALTEPLSIDGRTIEATLAYAPLPTVWVRAADIGLDPTAMPDVIDADVGLMAHLESLRRQGAVRMGLAPTAEQANLASPKVGIVGPPAAFTALDGVRYGAGAVDLLARVVSMGRVHKALPMACAMNLTAVALSAGSVPNAAGAVLPGRPTRLGTPSGVLTMQAVLDAGGDGPPRLERVSVETTARTLMEGLVRCD